MFLAVTYLENHDSTHLACDRLLFRLCKQFVDSILERGDREIATARQADERLQHLKREGASILDLDVTASQSELDTKVKEALETQCNFNLPIHSLVVILNVEFTRTL